MDTCAKTQDSIHDYYENKLETVEQVEIAHHLKTCSSCTEAYNSMETIFTQLPKAISVTPSPGFLRNLALGLEAERYKAQLRKTLWRLLIMALSIAGCLLLPAVVTVIFGQPASTVPNLFSTILAEMNATPQAAIERISLSGKGGMALAFVLALQLGVGTLMGISLARRST